MSTAGAGGSACRRRWEHDEPDGNVLSRGEGVPSPASTRCRGPGASDYELLLMMHLLSDLWPSWIANTPSSTLAMMASTTSLAAWTITPKIPGVRWLRHFGSYPFMPTSGSWTISTRRRCTGSTVMSSAIACFGWPLQRPIGIGRSLGVTNTTRRRWRETWSRDIPLWSEWGTLSSTKGRSLWPWDSFSMTYAIRNWLWASLATQITVSRRRRSWCTWRN